MYCMGEIFGINTVRDEKKKRVCNQKKKKKTVKSTV